MITPKLVTIVVLIAFTFLASCMGTGDIDNQKKDWDDSAAGRFMREIGPEEMDVLLNDPDDPLEPGLDIEHLLHLLDRCSIDRMIEVVRKCGARRTLDLLYSVRRLGCNRPVDGYPLGKYDIPAVNTCGDCSLGDYNYLDAVARLINGMNDAGKLALMINRESLDTPDPAGYGAFMEKLAYLIVYMDSPEKMIALVNGAIDARDIVFFVDMMDTDTVPPVSTADIVGGVRFRELGVIRLLFDAVTDPGKLHYLVNGARAVPGAGDDAAQIEYLRLKLVPIIAGGTDPADVWVLKLSSMINEVQRMQRLRSLICELDTGDIPSVVELWTGCDSPDQPPPFENSIGTMARVVDGVEEPSKLVLLMGGVSPGNMAALVNGVAAGSRKDDVGNPDAGAAGLKLSSVIDGTADTGDLVFLINSVSDFSSMCDLINALKVASTPKVAMLLNDISGANFWNPLGPASATGAGKLVNMIDNISSLSDTALLLDGVTDASKLSDLVNRIGNSSLVVSFINAVIADPRAGIEDLSGLLNSLSAGDVPKTARILEDLGGTRDTLMASLIAPCLSDSSSGMGFENMASLMSAVNGLEGAGRLAVLVSSLNPSLLYHGSLISEREGLVRLIENGVMYSGQAFPGLGAVHVAAMVNDAESAGDLAYVMNGIGVEMMAPLIGCGDRVGDPGGDGIPPFYPDFRTPCAASGMGW